MRKRISEYIEKWKNMGYPDDIPDEVPACLMKENLAPSYKAICLAILKNDHGMTSLGFTQKPSKWYSILKRIELDERAKNESLQQK
jgi:predicted phosphoadenosine phosphosulfate sulfurtransferase